VVSTQSKDQGLGFLEGGGRMGALMRLHDWTVAPLGDPGQWPETLKTAISTCLSSRFPMVVWWGPDLLMLYNDAWQPILGDTKHPAGLGRPGEESWPETWPVVGAQFRAALTGIASWSEDLLLASDRHGFLEEAYFTYSHSPLRDASGEIVGVLSVVSETTARVLNERRLRTLTQLSGTTTDAMRTLQPLAAMCQALVHTMCRANPDVPFAVQYLVDSEHHANIVATAGVDEANFPQHVDRSHRDAWGIAEVLDNRASVTIRRGPSDKLPGGIWPEPTLELMVLPLLLSGQQAQLCGILLVGINPRLRLDAPYVEFLRLVATQFGGAISGLQFVSREREARAEAQRASRMRDEFIATLSHELRSPLNAVVGWTQVLKHSKVNAELVATAVDVIERNAGLQARLVTDLLDISSAISGNLTLDLQDVDIAIVVGAAIESVAVTASAKNIAITASLAPISKLVRGDPARIQQMLWNLLTNAVKFTPQGGRVHVATESDDEAVRIRVSDTGEGIDPAFIPHLFERFRQGDGSSSRKHGGLGLGLAIVKQFAELHGGRISATSEGPGRGATFCLEIPLAAVARPLDDLSPSAVVAPNAQPSDLAGVRVLIVEDQPDALLIVKRIVESAGVIATEASSGEEALVILESESFDVIVSDISMPGMDGYALLAQLTKRGIASPVIALTAFALANDVARSVAAGFAAHVAKPIDRSSFLAVLSRLAWRGGH
jgi:signal transduction histidine kinase